MTARERFALIVAGFCLAAALLVTAIQLLLPHAVQEQPVKAVSVSGPRLWYSSAASPRLPLADGREEIIRSVLNIKRPMRFGDYVWNEERVPQGPVWVRVDLTRQLVSVFRGGHEIGTAVILYGADSMPTPAGTFPVLQKAKDYHSISYDAPMPYMLRLTADGVAIHGSNVRWGSATHGCIGVPLEFARLLFDQMQLGDSVIILKSPA